jgi:phage I-like protein
MINEPLERAVALDAKAHETDGPKWQQIAIVGQWAGHPSGPFQLGPKEFGEMVANFKATKNRRIPFDFEHASEMDPREGTIPTAGAPAQGWAIDLDNRGELGLFALVEWKEPARTYIREGKYLFVSPTIRFNPTEPKSGQRKGARLSSIALTNQPFLDGMMPVAATDKATSEPLAQKDEDLMTPEQISKLLEEKAALSARVDALVAEAKAAKDEGAAASLTLKDAVAKLEKADALVVTLTAEKAKRDETIVAERVDLAFSTYKDEKKLGEADKEAMALTLTSRPELFERLYPKAEPGTAHMLRNLTGDGKGATDEAKRPEAKPADEETIVTLADKFQASHKVDRDRAFAMAEREIKKRRATAAR